jgi:hypothetical protein
MVFQRKEAIYGRDYFKNYAESENSDKAEFPNDKGSQGRSESVGVRRNGIKESESLVRILEVGAHQYRSRADEEKSGRNAHHYLQEIKDEHIGEENHSQSIQAVSQHSQGSEKGRIDSVVQESGYWSEKSDGKIYQKSGISDFSDAKVLFHQIQREIQGKELVRKHQGQMDESDVLRNLLYFGNYFHIEILAFVCK